MALIKPASYGLLCKSKRCTEHLETPNLLNIVSTKEIFLGVSMVERAIGLFVCLFVLFINIPMELTHRASACPLESDLVSWVKLHPYSVAACWKCLLKKESTFLLPLAGAGVCTLPRILPHNNTK